jgi:hypothetical protein
MDRALLAAGRLAQALYFQPHVGAPLQPTKSKSMAAAHVTPAIWGTLLGLALHHHSHENNTNTSPDEAAVRTTNTNTNSTMTKQKFASILRTRHGIKSNHVGNKWTGVSLARWEELYHGWQWTYHSKNHQKNKYGSNWMSFPRLYSESLWSMMLWDISKNKRDVLEALLTLHETSPSHLPILDPQNALAQALQHDELARTEWASSYLLESPRLTTTTKNNGDDEDLRLSLAIEQLLMATSHQKEWDAVATAESMEVLCLHYLSSTGSRQAKPPSPNGYYSYDGGATKPDCVEVAVRELMDLLLWDEQVGSFNLNRLPVTAHPVLYQLYRPAMSTASSVAEQTQGRGQEWFDALSSLNGCEYLTNSPNGRTYELTPTMRNVAKVFQRLLIHHPRNKGTILTSASSTRSSRGDWTTLNDLQEFWNSNAGHRHHPPLELSLGRLTHRAAMSDDIIVHEVATVWLDGSNKSMDIRLRNDATRNTGFATVTHLRRNSAQAMIPPELYQGLYWAKRQGTVTSPCLDMLLLLAARGEENDVPGMEPSEQFLSSSSMDDLYREYLGCRTYGLDRRNLMELTATADLEREALARRHEQRTGDRILKDGIHHVASTMRKTEHDLQMGRPLLNWLLSEHPDVHLYTRESERPKRYHDKGLEDALLSLPSLLDDDDDANGTPVSNKSLRQRISENAFIRGSLLVTWMDWKTGRTSLMNSLLKLRPLEVVAFLAMMARNGAPRSRE